MKKEWSESFLDFDDLAGMPPILLSLPEAVSVVVMVTFLTVFVMGAQKIGAPVRFVNTDSTAKLLEIKEELMGLSKEYPIFRNVKIVGGGVSIPLNTDGFFLPGQAEVNANARRELVSLAQGLKKIKGDYEIAVEGHTDNSPLKKWKWKFPSNWELSAQRAAAIVRLFENYKIPPQTMVAVGYGSQDPVLPNQNDKGDDMPINQAKNRRVTIRVYPAKTNIGL